MNDFEFITSSHKSAYSLQDSTIDQDSSLWETYECPRGSLFLYTESISQKTGNVVTSDSVDTRIRVKYLYNTVSSRWSNWMPHQQILDTMPEKRQTLFRDVYTGGNVTNGDFGNRTSAYPIEI